MTHCPSPMVHCPTPVVFVPPVWIYTSAAAGGNDPEGMQTVGSIDAYLKGTRTEQPTSGPAGWLAEHTGIFRKQVEQLAPPDYLRGAKTFLADTGFRNIMLVDVDYETVYADKKNKNPEDLDEAVMAASAHMALPSANKLFITAFGKSPDFDLIMEAQFLRRHGYGKPPISIKMNGTPSIFFKQDGETEGAYDDRVENLAEKLQDDEAAREKFQHKYERRMNALLRDYGNHLSQVFPVRRLTREVFTNM